MYSSRYDERMTWSQSFVCGGVAGIISRTVTSPLEVVKVLAQVGAEQTRQGLAKTFVNVSKTEGIRAFWKGNWIACFRLFPYSSLHFLTFNSLMMSFENANEGHLSSMSSVFAGLGSTILAMFIVYPCDVVRTRLILQPIQPYKFYGNIRRTFKTVWRKEGFLAFFRGLVPSIFGVIPFAGGSFLAYQWLDEYPCLKTDNTDLQLVISACMTAAFAQTISYPFDTVRKKMQASRTYIYTGCEGTQVKYNGMCDVFAQTVQLSGFKGLWRGLTASLLKIVPSIFLTYLLYEQCRRVFLYQNGYTISPWDTIPRDDVDQSLLPHEVKSIYLFRNK